MYRERWIRVIGVLKVIIREWGENFWFLFIVLERYVMIDWLLGIFICEIRDNSIWFLRIFVILNFYGFYNIFRNYFWIVFVKK